MANIFAEARRFRCFRVEFLLHSGDIHEETTRSQQQNIWISLKLVSKTEILQWTGTGDNQFNTDNVFNIYYLCTEIYYNII